MKNIHYIGLLLACLSISTSAYAQKAKSAQALDDIFAPSKTQEILSTKEAQENAQERIKELEAGDKILIKTVYADYSFKHGKATIATKKIEGGIATNITASIDENYELKTAEVLSSLAKAMDRSTAYNEDIVLSKIAVLSLSLSTEALVKKGLIGEYIDGDFGIIVALTKNADDENSYLASLKIETAKGTIPAELNILKKNVDSCKIAGNIGDVAIAFKSESDTESYAISGDCDGEEVRANISNKIDLSLRLDSSILKEENGNGTVLKIRLAQNNANGTHTVTETLLNGEIYTSSYKGTTLIPYEEFKVLSEETQAQSE